MFENISLLVIIANSLVMVVDDSKVNPDPNPIFGVLEYVF